MGIGPAGIDFDRPPVMTDGLVRESLAADIGSSLRVLR
jgi:hypothetical protein